MNTEIYDQASRWFVKHRMGELRPQDKAQFDAWARLSPLHLQAYLEMNQVWEDVSAVDSSAMLSTEELLMRARAGDNVFPLSATGLSDEFSPGGLAPLPDAKHSNLPPSRSPRSKRLLVSLAFAASLVVVLATTWFMAQRNIYTTGIGEQRLLTLSDGSTVELNARSRIRVRYGQSMRDIDLLEGQALFRVAHNQVRPFLVHAGNARVRAVGTEFDVYRRSTGTVVTVVEGRVAIVPEAGGAAIRGFPGDQSVSQDMTTDRGPTMVQPMALSAGQQVTVTGNVASAPQAADVKAATAWTQRSLVFEAAPLTDVAAEFNRYNIKPLVIVSTSLAEFHVSGVFSSVDPGLLLRFLRRQPELSIEETDQEIRISKR